MMLFVFLDIIIQLVKLACELSIKGVQLGLHFPLYFERYMSSTKNNVDVNRHFK